MRASKRSTVFALAILFIVQLPLHGAERILVPLAFSGSGANGTHWRSSTWIYVAGDDASVWLRIPVDVCPLHCGDLIDQPFGTGLAGWLNLRDAPSPGFGRVAHVVQGDASRVVGVSRFGRGGPGGGSWWLGQVPIVREADLSDSPLYFLDVPPPSLKRRNLRIYTIGEAASFFVRTTELDSGEVTDERIVDVPKSDDPYRPGEISVTDFADGGFLNNGHVVEVRPLSDVPFWAFVTATDNVTQDVSVYLPQSPGRNITQEGFINASVSKVPHSGLHSAP